MSVLKSEWWLAAFAWILYGIGWSEQKLDTPWTAAGATDIAGVIVTNSASKQRLPVCWAFAACAHGKSKEDVWASASGAIRFPYSACNLFQLFYIKSLFVKCYFINSHCNTLHVFFTVCIIAKSKGETNDQSVLYLSLNQHMRRFYRLSHKKFILPW